MSNVDELVARMERAFTSVKEKAKARQQQELQHHQKRQTLFQEYEKVRTHIIEVAKPRLEALASRSGERVMVTPAVSETRRSIRFEFQSAKAHIALSFSVAPDREIQNAVVDCDLSIVPVLWSFDSHSEFSSPIAAFNSAAFTKWLDDRIIGFIELYIQIHEAEIYEKAEYVEDPIAKVKFPKFAAGASLEQGGQTYFFIDENTKAHFARQKGLAIK